MKLGLHINDFAWPVGPERTGPILAEIARAAEASGFERIAVMDHVWQHPYAGAPEGPVRGGVNSVPPPRLENGAAR